MMRRFATITLSIASVGLLATACSSETTTFSGQTPASGGALGAGGATVAGTSGGNQATGGANTSAGGNQATGGANTSAGGNQATGGAISAGGNQATGGANTSAGGNTATGGKATGGNTSAGGNTATGGKATGGNTSAGGSTAGGSTATGGKATGGNTSAGGSTATGGKATGGSTSAGGATATGGKATGGATATGGVTATGGGTSTSTCDNFSFFVTSLAGLRRESGSDVGYGGNLGGLTGADEICRKLAVNSLACAGTKTWRAFLSTSSVNAISRIGTGPWYDRLGRIVSNNTTELLNTRPAGADTAIKNDLPNEFGVPNHNPDGTGQVDNHDTLTGSNGQGTRYSASATCSDWTSTGSGSPRVGHSWPGGPSQEWINAMDANGCAAGVNLNGSVMSTGSCVGCMGGYGGFYCFATTP